MKHWTWPLLAFLLLPASCGVFHPPFPSQPGEIFLRLAVCDLDRFQKDFRGQFPQLKAHGLSAYSLHRDLSDPQTYILTFKCRDLNRGVGSVQSLDLTTSCPGARTPVIWCGVDTRERTYQKDPHPSGGIVIARNEVKSYDFWKKGFEAEGQHHHADRGYEASRYSIHHLDGQPASVIVVHEASDVSKAPAFMTAPAMKGVMQSLGVTGIDIWYGINLEEGIF